MLKYITSAPNFVAGTSSAVQTIQSSDAGGNATNVTSDTTVNLTSNSTGTNAKFYAVSGGVCTSTPITSITIANGTNVGQFCYYDEKAGSWSLTAAATGLTSAVQTATVTSTATLGGLNLALATPQKNRIAFTGTNTLTAIDNFGNTMTGFAASGNAITLTVSPASATVGGLDGTGAQLTTAGDFTNGIASLTSKLKLSGTVGTYTITATSTTDKTANATVTLAGGTLDHFDFALASPQAIAANFTGTNTLTARDIDNNIITAFDASANNVAVTESGAVGTVSGLGSGSNTVLNRNTDFVNGVASLTGAMKYIGPVGSHVFKATSGAVNTTSNAITFTVGAFTKFGVVLSTPQINAAPFTTATITAQDVYGNTVTAFDASTDNVTLSVSGTGSLNTTSLTSGSSFVGGVATLSGSLTFTGLTASHTITATSASGKTGNAATTITAGAPTSTKVVNGSGSGATQITTSTLTADQTLPLFAAGYDTSGNWTGLLSGNWSSTGTLAPTVANAAVTTMTFAPTTAPATGTIAFTNGSLNATTGTITVTPGVINHFIVTAPGTATAGTAISASMTAVDADGNTVTSYTGSQVITFSQPGNGPTGGTPTYPANVAFANGVASNIPITLVKAEAVKLKATQGAITGTSADIVISGATANSFGVSAPGAPIAGAPFDVQLTAYDAFGNIDVGYNGSHTLVFANPNNAPDGTAPNYPASVSFADGLGTANVTLFKREITSLKVTESTKTGTSGTISVASGPIASITRVSGDHQTGPVAQQLPLPVIVSVKDAYQNPKSTVNVGFAVTSGAGTVSNATVATASDGTAQVNWIMGGTPGPDSNTLQVTATGAVESPLTFTASSSGNGFLITTPSMVSTGLPFTIQMKVVDMNGATVTTYTGTKTITFTGLGNGPNGDKPAYPVTVTFVNGVAQPDPTITAVAVETASLTASDGTLSGTSMPFTINVGAATRLTMVTAPQEIKANEASGPVSVCRQDQYGNGVLGTEDRTITMAGTSSGSQFSTSATGPWNSYHVVLPVGSNCFTVYYKDSYAGARTITFSTPGLSDASQPIVITATTESPSTPSGGGTTTPGTNTTDTVTKNTETTQTITVYVDHPTRETSVPANQAQVVAIPIPAVAFPVITSPTTGGFVAPIDGNIITEGTAPPNRALRLISDTGTVIGSATSDQYGQWQALINQDKFDTSQQSIYAQLIGNNGVRGVSVQFAIKQRSLLERLITFVTL
jgi:hypothetical protein